MGRAATGTVQELHARHGGPFVRVRLTTATVRRVWLLGDAVVVDQSRDRHGDPVTDPYLWCLGGTDDLARLLPDVARALPGAPGFVGVETHAWHLLPAGWRQQSVSRWEAMWTDAEPLPAPGEGDVERLAADPGGDNLGNAEVDALLDRANPDSHGRPGDRGMLAWLGVRDPAERGLVAAGALARVGRPGTAHLRGVSTLPAHRGRGLGTAVSARLTRLGLATVSPVVTLGVYSDNRAAISVYRRLGFRHDRSFVSGPVAAPARG